MSNRTARKAADRDIAARALFEAFKATIAELDDVGWDTLPDSGVAMRSKHYYRREVTVAVEALWRAGRLSEEPPERFADRIAAHHHAELPHDDTEEASG